MFIENLLRTRRYARYFVQYEGDSDTNPLLKYTVQ